MDPPGNNRNDIRNDIFAKRVPKQTPIVPPLKGIRSSSYVDPYAEQS
jgi:hypothetical protein